MLYLFLLLICLSILILLICIIPLIAVALCCAPSPGLSSLILIIDLEVLLLGLLVGCAEASNLRICFIYDFNFLFSHLLICHQMISVNFELNLFTHQILRSNLKNMKSYLPSPALPIYYLSYCWKLFCFNGFCQKITLD